MNVYTVDHRSRPWQFSVSDEHPGRGAAAAGAGRPVWEHFNPRLRLVRVRRSRAADARQRRGQRPAENLPLVAVRYFRPDARGARCFQHARPRRTCSCMAPNAVNSTKPPNSDDGSGTGEPAIGTKPWALVPWSWMLVLLKKDGEFDV